MIPGYLRVAVVAVVLIICRAICAQELTENVTSSALTAPKAGFAQVQVVSGKVAGVHLPTDARRQDYDMPILTVSSMYGTDNAVTNSRFEIPYKTLAAALQAAPAGAVVVVLDQDEAASKDQVIRVDKDGIAVYTAKLIPVKDVILAGKDTHITGLQMAPLAGTQKDPPPTPP